MSGNYIDLFFKAKDKDNDNKVIFQLFIKSIKVLKVINSKGLDVFTEADDENPKPAELWFAVPIEYFELLRVADELQSYNIELVPVPRNSGYSENPEDTAIVNDAIETLILSGASTKGTNN
jgi:hypothetical protein